MASIDSKLAYLRRRAAKNDFDVEHLLQFAIIGDKCAIPVIRELTTKYNWPRSNKVDGYHVVPYARWAEVVCMYLEGGCDALVEYASGEEDDSFYFATAVLEELRSSKAVAAQVILAAQVAEDLPNRKKDAVQLASVINLTLSFDSPPAVSTKATAKLRCFLHKLLALSLTEVERATVVCALRGVGNTESIQIINELPPFEDYLRGLESKVCKAIRKRCVRA